MSAISPNEIPGLIIDEFIRYADAHLQSLQGTIQTISLYQLGPVPTPNIGLIVWNGYTVTPAKPSKKSTEDDFPSKESVEQQESQKLTKQEAVNNGVTEKEIDKKIEEENSFEEQNVEDEGGEVKFNKGKPFNIGARGGGFSPGFSGTIVVDLGQLDLSAEWTKLAAQFIGKNEGFARDAVNDEGTPRLGFGSDKILDASTGKLRDVKYGDSTTVDGALKVLQYEVSVSYKNRLVGNANYQISQADFDKLNNKQRAACLSFVYNCGSLRPGIAEAIRKGDYNAAALGLKNGPVTGAKTGTVYPGLVRRRSEEAALFSS